MYAAGTLGKALDDVRSLQIALGYQPSNSATQSGIIDGEALRELIRESIGVEADRAGTMEYEVSRLRSIVDFLVRIEALGRIGRSLEKTLRDTLDSLISFREVDRAVPFASMDSSELSFQSYRVKDSDGAHE